MKIAGFTDESDDDVSTEDEPEDGVEDGFSLDKQPEYLAPAKAGLERHGCFNTAYSQACLTVQRILRPERQADRKQTFNSDYFSKKLTIFRPSSPSAYPRYVHVDPPEQIACIKRGNALCAVSILQLCCS